MDSGQLSMKWQVNNTALWHAVYYPVRKCCCFYYRIFRNTYSEPAFKICLGLPSYSISRENVVGIVTTLQAELYGIRIPVKATDFSVPQNVHAVSEPHPPCYSVDTEIHSWS